MRKAIKQLHIYRGIVSIIVFCMLCVNVTIPVWAEEASGSCGTFLEWSLSGDVLTISGSGDMADYSDSKLAPWHPYAEDIKTISLPSGLLSIGDFAFYGCTNLTSIRIPEKVISIGEYAFAQCTEMQQANWGNNLEKLGEGAFQGCESLQDVSFPASLTEIGAKAFYRCYGLQMIVVPETVQNIGSSAFAYCTGLVRVIVNAPISSLPGWAFYGCKNLTDVSLAPTITSVGPYAFESCSSLNGIYTQSASDDTAYELEQNISKSQESPMEGFVASYDMPESSIVTTDDGKEIIQTTVTQTEGTVVTTTEITDHSEENKDEIIIQASVTTENDWIQLEKVTSEVANIEKSKDIFVEITLADAIVDSEMLELFAGKNIVLKIALENGVVWKIYMQEMTEKDFSGKYDFNVTVSMEDLEKTEIVGEKVYRLKFADKIDFNTSIGFEEGSNYDLVSLYQKEEGTYQIINTVIVDQYGWAWFSLGKIDKKTEYCIGLNVEGVQRNDAVIPDTMLPDYDIDEQDEESYLMDTDGVKYQITGRSSKWGISGKQFAIYVAVAIFATVLVVGIIMTTLNIIRRSKERYERMAEEDAVKEQSENELRMEIMRELLNKDNNIE